MAFKKAEKWQSKLRLALFGPAGAGKTMTALRIATGMASKTGKIALIDTEHGSASKYADRFTFDTDNLDLASISNLVEKIEEASEYDVLIIDSLSHAWQELLEDMDKLAAAKYKGNTWSAWSEGTPKQRQLVRAILGFPGHIIATMRSKTEWTTEKDSNGKSRPQRVGLAPEQGKGIEYEFDMLMELSTEHYASVIKDRTGKYQDSIFEKPSEKFGAELVEWLSSGVALPPPPPKVHELTQEEREAAKAELQELITALGETMTASVGAVAAFSEERRKVYRDRKAAADIKGRGVGALADMRQIVADAEGELIKLRADWETAGSPTPRPAVLKPVQNPAPQGAAPAQAPAQPMPGPQTDLSPAAQKVADLAGVTVPQKEMEAVGVTVGPESEELGLF